MKQSFLVLIVLSVLLSTCKKKEDSMATPVTVVPDDPGTFRGFLTACTWTSSIGGSEAIVGQRAEARIYSQPAKGFGGITDVNLKYLAVNNRLLTNKDRTEYMLVGAPDTLNLSHDTWLVGGSNGIPDFSFTNLTPYPSCSNFNCVPDSISKSKGCTITVSNVSGLGSGVVSITDNVSAMLNYTLVAGTNLIQIQPSDLAALATGTIGTITLSMENSIAHSVSGKNFQFNKLAYLTKPVTIYP